MPPPQNFTATVISETKVMLSWSEVIASATYHIIRSNKDFGTKHFRTNSLSYLDSNLIPGTEYSYEVYAEYYNRHYYYGENSETVIVTTTGIKPNIPDAPENITVKASETINRSINITWDPVPNAAYYEVFSIVEFDNNYKRLYYDNYKQERKLFSASPITDTTFSHNGCSVGNYYTYKVRAIDAKGNIGKFGYIYKRTKPKGEEDFSNKMKALPLTKNLIEDFSFVKSTESIWVSFLTDANGKADITFNHYSNNENSIYISIYKDNANSLEFIKEIFCKKNLTEKINGNPSDKYFIRMDYTKGLNNDNRIAILLHGEDE
ncbi:MAG: fibronectin type III domain-containing protein [Treponema sp.]|nr:fibronectin type III domain-containing protein [Treponema sp.]